MMKKRAVIILVSILITVFCYRASAIVGVAPASYEIDFSPNLEQSFIFDFMFDPDAKAEIRASGDLEKYVKLNRDSIVGSSRVVATLKLPSDIEVPGTHQIGIIAKQSAEEGGGVKLIGEIIGVIKVKVPYPGKYAEIELYTKNANAGEPVELTVLVKNLGKEDIVATTLLEVLDNQDNHIENLNLGTEFIKSAEKGQFQKSLSTESYKAGDYKVKAIVEYGGEKAEAEGSFRLGSLYVGISNYTKEFEKNKLNKLDIEAESFWNDPIDALYANVTIMDYGISFLTPSMDIQPWSKQRLTGYFDTSQIQENKFKAEIVLHYEGRTTSETVELRFKKEINYTLYLVAGGAALLIIILIIIIIILIKRNKNAGKKK